MSRIAQATWDRLRLLLIAGVVAPGLMVAAGLAAAYLFGKRLSLATGPSLHTVGWALLAAALSMTLVSGIAKVHPSIEAALKKTGAQAGVEALRTAGYPVMLFIVAAAGVGEEILFRGGLQPIIGLVPTAVLFGFSHGGWRREMWAYVLVASLSGALFGLLYRWSGDLWLPIITHVMHNVASVALMGKRLAVSRRGWVPVIALVTNEETDSEEADDMRPAWQTPYIQRPTARALGIAPGFLTPGPSNTITDVPGVRVGHATVVAGEGDLRPGAGPVRTGVTAILPHGGNLFTDKVPAGLFVLNGFGKSTGLPQVEEMGVLETPILLTNTLSTYRAADALVSYMIEQNPAIGISTSTVNPLVGECNDGWLNDVQGRHVTEEHVRAALSSADTGPVAQGAVGAGTGMVCFGFKGGIGSASRRAGDYSVGALVQANFGRRHQLIVNGLSVGQRLIDYREAQPEPEAVPPGSVMVIVATDAPLDARQLSRLAKRAALGLGRVGGSASNGSGEFVIAFSTDHRLYHEESSPMRTVALLRDGTAQLDQLFEAAVEVAEEAVLNALFTASTVVGRDGRSAPALPVEPILAWAAAARS